MHSYFTQALLRYKRLGQSVYVRLPCSDTRRLLLKKELGKMCTSPDIDIECLVEKTEMFSGDEVSFAVDNGIDQCAAYFTN